ncbi:hypothetical protein [Candidatus Cryosericum odellii]|jgi:hypothetical protein|uniref:Uncharacterized protein n=1 Tax=Candidatus Cryosericum odellii TaxID=2290917 RepID=A0A398CXA7_9BACT|nr:hypothetical protein [Candidatus Cryosericum odellii]RIE07295.1 hypothetical protein SMC6_06895 [Candidatus Cryosericum odellii]
MKTTTSRFRPVMAIFTSILLAVVLVPTGCAPKVVPVEGPQISMMLETNFTSSEYDAGSLLLWNIGQNTLHISGTSVVHVSEIDYGGLPLFWQPGSPVRVVQQWGIPSKKALITATSKDIRMLVPPVGMQSAPTTGGLFTRWYVPEKDAFVVVPLEVSASSSQKTVMTVTEQGVASGSKSQLLTVPVPSGLAQIDVLYGSGSTSNGFVLVEARDNVVTNAADSLWLLHMNNRTGSWVRCGNLSAFGGSLIPDQSPSFARVGTLLYFTHSHTKIGCIDTTVVSPSVMLPEEINTLLVRLFKEGPQNAEGPLQAQLASSSDTLIVSYPDVHGNPVYYDVDISGTVLGSLRADKTSVTSFDANGKQGSSLKTPGSPGYVSFPSYDLFQGNIF